MTTSPSGNKASSSTPIITPTRIGSDGLRIVPSEFQYCQVDDLITLIASMFEKIMEHNDKIPLTSSALTRFHSRAPPSIGVKDYLLRIEKFTNVEPVCLLILLHYVDKVCNRLPTFTISSLTVHRFIIACISVGSKALSDSFCTNGRYARVGGISCNEMNLLEREFCEAIDWRLTTTGEVLAHYYNSLVKSHEGYVLDDPPVKPIPRQVPKQSHAEPKTLSKEASTEGIVYTTTGDEVTLENNYPGTPALSIREKSYQTPPTNASVSMNARPSSSGSSISVSPTLSPSPTTSPQADAEGLVATPNTSKRPRPQVSASSNKALKSPRNKFDRAEMSGSRANSPLIASHVVKEKGDIFVDAQSTPDPSPSRKSPLSPNMALRVQTLDISTNEYDSLPNSSGTRDDSPTASKIEPGNSRMLRDTLTRRPSIIDTVLGISAHSSVGSSIVAHGE